MATERNRMIFDLPAEVQMAIRLKAAKTNATNAETVATAIKLAYPQEMKEAIGVIKNVKGG